MNDSTAHDTNSKARKYPFKKNVPIPGNVSFQIELMEILQRHKTDVKLHDEIINLLDHYLTAGKIDPTNKNFSSRKKFIRKIGRDFSTTVMKPKHIPITLEGGSKATISLLDTKFMILSLLTDDFLMQDENLAPGYDIFTGDVDPNHPDGKNYGKIHTGDAW